MSLGWYYNEFDDYAADWLENLIADGQLPPGFVDRRNLWDVPPDDLIGYEQWHLCAGIGGWPLAIMRAGYAEQRGIFSVSAPCQPYSAAGLGMGFADERHLWPACYHHIGHLRPRIIVGEQVSSKLALEWWRLVSDDLQAARYRPVAVDTSVASIGGPHIRQRLYWMAHTAPSRRGEECALGSGQRVGDGTQGRSAGYVNGGEPVRLEHSDESRSQGRSALPERADKCAVGPGGVAERVDDPAGSRHVGAIQDAEGNPRSETRLRVPDAGRGDDRPNPLHGPWRDADWLFCSDARWRPIEPGATALAHGLPRGMGTLSPRLGELAVLAGADGRSLRDAKRYRVGSLKGYGNAICVEQAEGWMRAVMSVVP